MCASLCACAAYAFIRYLCACASAFCKREIVLCLDIYVCVYVCLFVCAFLCLFVYVFVRLFVSFILCSFVLTYIWLAGLLVVEFLDCLGGLLSGCFANRLIVWLDGWSVG